jgi:hypothetical protein
MGKHSYKEQIKSEDYKELKKKERSKEQGARADKTKAGNPVITVYAHSVLSHITLFLFLNKINYFLMLS